MPQPSSRREWLEEVALRSRLGSAAAGNESPPEEETRKPAVRCPLTDSYDDAWQRLRHAFRSVIGSSIFPGKVCAELVDSLDLEFIDSDSLAQG